MEKEKKATKKDTRVRMSREKYEQLAADAAFGQKCRVMEFESQLTLAKGQLKEKEKEAERLLNNYNLIRQEKGVIVDEYSTLQAEHSILLDRVLELENLSWWRRLFRIYPAETKLPKDNYFTRLKKEAAELSVRIEKLDVFINKSPHPVRVQQFQLMKSQLKAMNEYSNILIARIKDIEDTSRPDNNN